MPFYFSLQTEGLRCMDPGKIISLEVVPGRAFEQFLRPNNDILEKYRKSARFGI